MDKILQVKQSLSQKIIKNTAYNIVGKFWGVLVTVFLTPYIISNIGIERFGIWSIVGVLTTYFGLLDFGISTSFVKYISEYYARKEYDKINQIINTGIVFYSLLSIIIIILALLFVNPLLNFFKIPPAFYREAFIVFLLGLSLFAFSNSLSPLTAIQTGLQRMDISNFFAMVISIPYVIGVFFFLKKGYGLVGLMVNNAIIFIISSIFNFAIAVKIYPELKISILLFRKKIFRKLFLFGYKMQLARLSSLISVHMDKLIINHFLSIGLVSFYQLGSSVIETGKSVALLLPSALMPAFSELDANGERSKLIEGYFRSTRYLVLAVAPFFTFLIISAPQIMAVWMGRGYERSAWIIQILGVGWGLALISSIRSTMVMALAKPEIEMKAGFVAIMFNIPLSILLVIKFGFLGAAVGTSLALIFSVIYGYTKLHKEIQVPFWPFIKATSLKTIMICIGVGVLIGYLTKIFYGSGVGAGRLTSLFVFISQALVFFAIYLSILFYTKPLDEKDLNLLINDRVFLKGFLKNFVG